MAILFYSLVAVTPALLALLCLISFVRRLYFSPLSKIPGPKAAILTTWWEAWVDIFYGSGGQYYFELQRLHEKYGPIVRIGPSEVHVHDAEWLRVLFGGPGTVRDKHESLAHIVGSDRGTFGTVNHHLHRMRRNAVAPFFSKRAVATIEPRIRAGAEQMCRFIDSVLEEPGQSFEIRLTYLAWVTDTLTSYIFDQSTGILGNEKSARDWYGLFEKLEPLYPVLKQNNWIVPLALKLPLPVVRYILPQLEPLLVSYKVMQEQARSVWQKRNASITGVEKHSEGKAQTEEEMHDDAEMVQTNLFWAIVRSSLPEQEKAWERMAHEALEITLAGTATVSRVLTVATYHILANPGVKKVLREELERLMPDPAVIPEVKTLEQSAYLGAVLKESLRIARATTFRYPLVAREDLVYKGYRLPAGVIVSATLTFCLQDPEVYPNPEAFLPARWLESSEPHLAAMERNFLPFGLGNRSCLGANLAKAELLVGLAVLFRRYTWELVDTIRERDVDHKRAWLTGEPSRESPGIHVRPLTSWRNQQ